MAKGMTSTAATNDTIPSEASCWICLDEGPDEGGSNILRSCACRGSAGYVHISCIAEYAQRTMMASLGKDGRDDVDCERWILCPTCKTEYGVQIGSTLARRFWKEGGDWPEEHRIYTTSLQNMARMHQLEDDGLAAIPKFEKLVKIARRIEDTVLLASALKSLATCYAVGERTADAVRLYEESYELWVQLEGAEGRMARSCHTMLSSTKASQNQDSALMIKIHKEELQTFEERYGLKKGAIHRRSALLHRYIPLIQKGDKQYLAEAKELGRESLELSRRLLGPEHELTQEVLQQHQLLEAVTERSQTAIFTGLVNRPYLNGKGAEVLHSVMDGKYYLVNICVNGKPMRMKAPVDNVLLQPGTSIVVDGLVNASDLNGSKGRIMNFVKEKGRYAVLISLEEEERSVLVKLRNCRIPM